MANRFTSRTHVKGTSDSSIMMLFFVLFKSAAVHEERYQRQGLLVTVVTVSTTSTSTSYLEFLINIC